jgi:putative ABC transport system permease protein
LGIMAIIRSDDGHPERAADRARGSRIALLGGFVAAVWLGTILALQPPFQDRTGSEALPHLSVEPIPVGGVEWGEDTRGPGGAYASTESMLLTTSVILLLLVAGVAGLGQMALAGVAAVARRGEIRLRRALGAPRRRLVWDLGREALRALGPAALVGIAAAFVFGAMLLAAFPEASVAGAPDLSVGLLAAVFASGTLLAWAAFSFGVVQSGEMVPGGPLRRDTPLGEPFRGELCHPGVPVLQIAVATLVVVSTGLLLRGAGLGPAAGSGDRTDGREATLALDRLVIQSDPDGAGAMVTAVLSRIAQEKAAGGVGAASLTSPGFWEGTGHVRYAETECGYCFRPGNPPTLAPLMGEPAVHHFVSPDTFRLAGIVLVEGRGFTEADGPDGEPVAVVTRGFARRNFQDGEALGRQVRVGSDRQRWHTVVGVVEPLPRRSYPAHRQPEGDVLLPVAQRPPVAVELAAASVLPRMEGGFAPGIRILDQAPLEQRTAAIRTWLGAYASAWRWIALGGLALALLGTVVIVGRRIRDEAPEIALRRALGAGRLRLLLRQTAFGLRVGLVGTLLGSFVALFLVWELVPGGFGAGSDLGVLFLGTVGGLTAAAALAGSGAALGALRGPPREGMEP